MSEHISDMGYGLLKKEAIKGVPVVPNIAFPLVRETMSINPHLEDLNPIMGIKLARYQSIKGFRDIDGEIEVFTEPNTIGYFLDMLLKRTSSVNNSGIYTHTFGIDPINNPNSYTIDIAKGLVVHRFFGVEAREMTPSHNDNKMHSVFPVSALGDFLTRTVSSINTGSTTITLNQAYDDNPTLGLVTGDLIRVWAAGAGTYQDVVVNAITDATHFTYTGTLTGVVAGDIVTLRPQTITTNWLDWFQWVKTQFLFGANITAAASAAQTNMEKGTIWHIFHNMMPNQGMHRSGARNPLSLVRGVGDMQFHSTIYFDTPDESQRFFDSINRAVIIKALAGTTNQYSLSVNIPSMIPSTDAVPVNINTIITHNQDWKVLYDQTTAKMFDVTLLNTVPTY